MHTTQTTNTPKTRRVRRFLMAAVAVGALTAGLGASGLPAGAVSLPEGLPISDDPCNTQTHGCEPDGWDPSDHCEETPQLCDFTTPTTEPDDTPDPEEQPTPDADVEPSDVVKVSPRFTG